MSMAGVVYAAAKKYKGFKQAYKGRQKQLLKHQKRWTVRNRVYIDCDHSKVKSESTRSKVTIQVLSSSKKVIATKTYGRGISKKICTKSVKVLDYKKKSTTKKSDVEGRIVIVSIEGGDAFLIDAIKLKVSNRKDNRWGRNNGKAWCLSTQKNDAKKSWKNFSSACYRRFEFRTNGKSYGR